MIYLYMSLELGRTNIFVIEKCAAPQLSLKIRYCRKVKFVPRRATVIIPEEN